MSREWQEQWLETHGRRFCLYKKRKDAGVQRTWQKPGTKVALQRGRKKATAELLTRAESQKGDAPSILGNTTVGELRRAMKDGWAEMEWNKKLKKFHDITKRKTAANVVEKQRRSERLQPYGEQKKAPGHAIAPRPGLQPATFSCSRFARILNACPEALALPNAQVQSCSSCSSMAILRMLASAGQSCVIVPKQLNFSSKQATDMDCKLALGVVGLGATVVTKDSLPRGAGSKSYIAASQQGPAKVVTLASRFIVKHPSYTQQLKYVSGLEKSKWTVLEESDADRRQAQSRKKFNWSSQSIRLEDFGDFMNFLSASILITHCETGVSCQLFGE